VLQSPTEIAAEGTEENLTAKAIILATGARPRSIPSLPIDGSLVMTSREALETKAMPKSAIFVGGGPIGCELAQTFARLGSQVTQVQRQPRLMVREDPEACQLVKQSLEDSGVQVLTGHNAIRFSNEAGEKYLHVEHEGEEKALPFDAVLVAVGRQANTDNLGLETLALPTDPDGTIQTNELLQSRYPNIYACGDVAGPYQFTHTAAHQAWYAAVNALFGFLKSFKVDYRVIPWCTFTSPEVARVGLNEQEADAQGIDYEVTRYGIDDLDRAIADSADEGYVKVITASGSDRILGVTIVGQHAGELIAEYVLAMKHGLGLNKILGTIHIYPTMAEANKFAAGEWKKAHKPEGVLRWVERFHDWRR
ncbi:NAD(P)/FAD-dependent oxidoreductase, partial [uncultured Alcanivorax sp.]|uniref:dihydrolipoyl dehydrogenase family protein n=1 Tax=uncultured Alcanivorax sp. TaxID=191215 RepID=UPI00261D2310